MVAGASEGLVERQSLLETIVLAAIAGEHVLVIGPPGTGKSEAVRRVARAIGGSYFEYLLGKFTEPSEIFGPVDLSRLRDGVIETRTAGMLPEAEVAFLDEVFLGSTAILNTLLAILNERTFRRGHTQRECPLRVCVGAANALPEDEMLAAFADRFLLRVFVSPVADHGLEELLERGWIRSARPLPTGSIAHLDKLRDAVGTVDLSEVTPALAQAVRSLRREGISLSDRRIVRLQSLIAAAAVADGRQRARAADLWPIILALPTREIQDRGREVLRELLSASINELLPAAAEDAASGPLARAHRLALAGREVLESRPHGADDAATATWHLKIEGLAREIDAGFAKEAMPPALADLRARIAQIFAARSDE